MRGAIGFAYEHALHFATRRLWRSEFGTETGRAERLGRETCARGADVAWEYVTRR